ncbi:MAG: hypothetical protein WCW02_02840 [Candidatus Buchananbacteria bacterium]
METLYRHIIKEAWQVVIKRPYLWFFGLFAAFFAGANEYSIIVNSTQIYQTGVPGVLASVLQTLRQTGLSNAPLLKNLMKIWVKDPVALLSFFAFLILLLAAIVFVVWLIVVSQIALISAVQKISQNKNSEFNNQLRLGKSKFWPALGYNILLKATIFLLVLVVVSLGLKLLTYGGTGLGLFLISYVLLIIAMMILAFIIKFALCYLGLKDQNFLDSIISAIKLFKNHWLICLEMALLVFLISFVVGLILAVIVAALILPFLLLTYLTLLLKFVLGFFLTITLAFILIFGVIAWVVAVLSAWQWSAWTLLFIKLDAEGATSKIVRLSKQLPNFFHAN